MMIISPVKVISRASACFCNLPKIKLSVNPVSAVQIAMRKMETPAILCSGWTVFLLGSDTPGTQKEKNPNNHCRITLKYTSMVRRGLATCLHTEYNENNLDIRQINVTTD